MKQLKVWLFCITVLFYTGCSKDDTVQDSGAKEIMDVSYGSNPLQKLDIYLPANSNQNTTKVIVLIHGGGWTTGDKSLSTQYVDTLQKRLPEYAIFNINYRLASGTTNIFPAQESDVKSAIEFIYSKRSEYNISDKFVLIGESAGGHLAMLYAYKYNAPVKIKAVVSFFGPSDLIDMYNNPVGGNPVISAGIVAALGSTPSANPALYASSSPVNFISGNSAVPTILLHGGMDNLVHPSQSIQVRDRLTTAGIVNQYVFYPNKSHGYDWDPPTFSDAFNKIQQFLSTYVM